MSGRSRALLAVLAAGLLASAASKKDLCGVCRRVVEKFEKGLGETKKSGFGGGNTDWEERALGDYANR